MQTANRPTHNGDFAVIRIQGSRLDATARSAVRQLAEDAWTRGAKVLALDLSSVAEIDSLGISALIAIARRLPPGGRVVCCGLSDYVRDIFEITQLFRVFDVFESADAAARWHSGSRARAA